MKRHILGILFAGVLLAASGCAFGKMGSTPTPTVTPIPTSTPTPTEIPIEDFETAKETVAKMGLGWNLGNYFDATGSYLAGGSVEKFLTGWGNPVVDEFLFKKLKTMGFSTVRIPVTWRYHFDTNGTIDEKWMAKVKEAVDWAINNGLYCIINFHHDTGSDGWIRASTANYEKYHERVALLWKQVAETFRDYPETLMFEGFNEMLDENSDWNNASDDAGKAINLYNQLFVDTVRSTGGNNTVRNLICNTYAAATGDSVLSRFKIPEDSTEEHILGQVHFYMPYEFITNEGITWTTPISEYNDYVENTVDTAIARIAKCFDKLNVPVIIGEFATDDKDNTADRIKWYTRIVSGAAEKGIACIIWDNGHGFSMGHIDRTGDNDDFPEIIEACLKALSE